jgi:hypothetical protein
MTTAAEMLGRLERHYLKSGADLPGGMLIPEVTHGKQGGRRCDALFVGFTSASGRILVGHEIKVSRSDWLHELAQPGKADAWADECHAWYIVAPDETVVRPEEVPHGWGLLLATGARTRLTVKVKATVHAERTPSWTAMRSLLSRVDTLRASEVRRGVAAEADKIRARYERDYVRRGQESWTDDQRDRLQRAEALLREINHALGVHVTNEPQDWTPRQVTPAALEQLRPLLTQNVAAEQLRRELERAGERIAAIAKDLQDDVAVAIDGIGAAMGGAA